MERATVQDGIVEEEDNRVPRDPVSFAETSHGGAYFFDGARNVGAQDGGVRLDVDISLLDLPVVFLQVSTMLSEEHGSPERTEALYWLEQRNNGLERYEPIDRVRGDGAATNDDLVWPWGCGNGSGDELELGFGRGDNCCFVGHFG